MRLRYPGEVRSMALNKAKRDDYVNKLFKGDFKRYKEKHERDTSYTWGIFFGEEKKGTNGARVAPNSAQWIKVIDDHKRKCATCGKKYDEDPSDFEIHHVNGDRSYTVTSNLVLLCHSCHKNIHNGAKAELKDWINEHKPQGKPKPPTFKPPTFKPPAFKPPTFKPPKL